MVRFYGREISEWEDIYKLLAFNGKALESFKDLYAWSSPSSPEECLLLGFELCEARKQFPQTPVSDWIYNIMTSYQHKETNEASNESK